MAKKAYIGVSNVARKVKKIYVGVNGIAKKVKKGYVGIAGIARCFFGAGDTVVYKGTAPGFTHPRADHAATTIGPYAIFNFGFGKNGSSSYYPQYYEAYTEALVHSTGFINTSFQTASATSLSNYGVFLYSKTVFYLLTSTLTTTTRSFSSGAYHGAASSTLDDVAIFYGGGGVTDISYSASLLTNTLTHSTKFIERNQLNNTAACTEDYFLTAGCGQMQQGGVSYFDYAYSDRVTSINKSHTLSYVTLPSRVTDTCAVSLNGHVLFCGGITIGLMNSGPVMRSAADSDLVYNFDNSLTMSYAPTLSTPRGKSVAVNLANNALIAGGQRATSAYSIYAYSYGANYELVNNVDYYDKTFTKRSVAPLSEVRLGHAGTALGELAFVGSGATTSDYSTVTGTVDVYCLD